MVSRTLSDSTSSASSTQGSTREVVDWTVTDVVEFLKTDGELETLAPIFGRSRIDGSALLRLSVEDVEKLGFSPENSRLLIQKRDELVPKTQSSWELTPDFYLERKKKKSGKKKSKNLETENVNSTEVFDEQTKATAKKKSSCSGSCGKHAKSGQIGALLFTTLCFGLSVMVAMLDNYVLAWFSFAYGGGYCLAALIVWFCFVCRQRKEKANCERRFTLVCAVIQLTLSIAWGTFGIVYLVVIAPNQYDPNGGRN